MFEIRCAYQPTAWGMIFLPEDIESDYGATLRVHFDPLDYYPAERDVGAGAEFVAEIGIIEMCDDRDCTSNSHRSSPWRTLQGLTRQAAIDFLEQSHHDEMWAQADEETAEAFGLDYYGRAA
jgi:hypothetical protein